MRRRFQAVTATGFKSSLYVSHQSDPKVGATFGENSAEVSVSIRGSSTLGNGRIPLSKVKSVSVTDPHLSNLSRIGQKFDRCGVTESGKKVVAAGGGGQKDGELGVC